jgi:hypothetical protein
MRSDGRERATHLAVVSRPEREGDKAETREADVDLVQIELESVCNRSRLLSRELRHSPIAAGSRQRFVTQARRFGAGFAAPRKGSTCFGSIESPRELFTYQLGAALTLEKTVLDMLGQLETPLSAELKEQLRHHAQETEQQIRNLEQRSRRSAPRSTTSRARRSRASRRARR